MANADATFTLSEVACLVAVLLVVGGLSAAPVSGGWCIRSTRLLCTFTAICCSNEVVGSVSLINVVVFLDGFLVIQARDEEAGKQLARVNVIVGIFNRAKC
jgi:hypothetical protein